MSNRVINLIGWYLFIASALGFLVSSLKFGDPWAILGALFFLIACLVFLIPFHRKTEDREPD